MTFSQSAPVLILGGALLLAIPACSSSTSVPSSDSAAGATATRASYASMPWPNGSTSILKQLHKDVVIGSSVDQSNGDRGPRGISVFSQTAALKKGQILVCNFADSSGAAGRGTTIEVFDPHPNSNPRQFAQTSKVEGCAGTAPIDNDGVDAAAATSRLLVTFSSAGSVVATVGPPFEAPVSTLNASEHMFASDVMTGAIASFSTGRYGNHKVLGVISGFDVNKKSGWGALGPSSLAYDAKQDVLYVVDGVDDVVDSFNHASELGVKNEIVVKPGGKTFACKNPSTSCGAVVYSGKPLDAPVAVTLLSNGNLIVANSAGGNTLVELARNGTVLDTRIVDEKRTAGVFSVFAIGKNDADTKVYYTDANDNDLHRLERR